MGKFRVLKQLRDDESGAVTVDWVVLTAAIVGLALVVIAAVRDSSISLADRIADAIDAVRPGLNCHPHSGGPPHCI